MEPGTNGADGDALFVAGTKAPPGLYRRVDGRREITLESEDYLPASLDGQVACYVRVQLWAYYEQRSAPLASEKTTECSRRS
jgi:hypothetical protein